MKYLILFAALSMPVFAQNINPVYEINRYTVPGKESVTEAKTSALHAKAEAAAIMCKCKVPFRTQGYYDGSVLTSSSSKSSASSSSVKSSAAASSVPAWVTLSWECNLERESGEKMVESEIGGYVIKANGAVIHDLAPTNCKMSQIVDALPAGQVFEIAAYDTAGLFSGYVPFVEN